MDRRKSQVKRKWNWGMKDKEEGGKRAIRMQRESTIKENNRRVTNHGNRETKFALVAATVPSCKAICEIFHIEDFQKRINRIANYFFRKSFDARVEGELLAASEGFDEGVELRAPSEITQSIAIRG